MSTLKISNQLLSENKLYSLNSTCKFSALKNLQFRFQISQLLKVTLPLRMKLIMIV